VGGDIVRFRHLYALLATAALVGMLLPAGVAAKQPSSSASSRFTATPLVASDRIDVSKAASSRLAQSDPGLLARTDTTPVHAMIKLDFDATASYAGGISGLAATSPSVTGKKLTGTSAAEQAYGRYVNQKVASFSTALHGAVPGASVAKTYDIVYGGVSATIPAAAAKTIAALPGVVAVQYDALQQPLTDASPEFVDAVPVYGDLGTTADAGAGVIYGNLDTGIWPEHPSFADLGNLSAPPATADGHARSCNFGDNPLTAAVDVFQCNNKVIGGVWETETYDFVYPSGAGADIYKGTARDGEGHGTHTASTTAGDIVESVPLLGVDRGPIHGLAPGAQIIEYKVCGPLGCFNSDSAAAVEQAILDGVNVINFSISGGSSPYTDPVELAFLDAYAAGVFVAASAGNAGPGAGTSDHLSPWVTTVGASTQAREFATTLTLTADNGDTFTADGASVTSGVDTYPVVLAQDVPGYGDKLCGTEPPATDTFAGMIVACQRGTQARAWKGYVAYEGGAEGMILYNPALQDVETDNHWLPAIHLADGTAFLAFMAAHTGVTGSFPAAEKRFGQGDVMAAFSSRGPAGLFIKPDVTAPGVEILAGNTPTPEAPDSNNGAGPAGEYYQAIAGTSMSSPHVAGAAILVKAVHPDWSPAEIKSALMTTAKTAVVKENLFTPADPFDMGGGRIDVAAAASAPLVFDETADNFFTMGGDATQAAQLNIASIDAPVLPGRLVVTRIVANATSGPLHVSVSTSAPFGSTISVSPSKFTVARGHAETLTITIQTSAPLGAQQFGSITLSSGGASQHLPVAFIHAQGSVSLTQGCSPTELPAKGTADCVVQATNNSFDPQAVDLTTSVDGVLKVTATQGASGKNPVHVQATLAGAQLGIPSYGPGASPAGYLPLSLFGFTPTALGDETIVNYNVPPFRYDGQVWTRVGVVSDGYVVVGGGTSQDVQYLPPSGPSPERPNNVLAPFWTDLDGTGAPGAFVGILGDGTNSWLVLEEHLFVWGTSDLRTFQVWIGLDGVQDISYTYSAAESDPNGQPFLVGAENAIGQGDMRAELPDGSDLVVTSTDPTPGGSATYHVFVQGNKAGTGTVTTSMIAPAVPGVTVVQTPITVTSKK
jgi:Subtilase family/Fibronectin type-III domain/PA domain